MCHTSHITHHTSHITPRTSHVTYHASHVTHHLHQYAIHAIISVQLLHSLHHILKLLNRNTVVKSASHSKHLLTGIHSECHVWHDRETNYYNRNSAAKTMQQPFVIIPTSAQALCLNATYMSKMLHKNTAGSRTRTSLNPACCPRAQFPGTAPCSASTRAAPADTTRFKADLVFCF